MLNYLPSHYTSRFSPGSIMLFAILFFGFLGYTMFHLHDDPNAAFRQAYLERSAAMTKQISDRCEKSPIGTLIELDATHVYVCTGGRAYLPGEKRR